MSARLQSLLRSLCCFLVIAGSAVPATAAGETPLAVPFLPQTEALCGGAAAAMVYRYWGDAHADVQQFAPLVDRRTGGIRDRDLVAAITARGWHTETAAGSLAAVRAALDARIPPILLIEDRPNRYHFVVAVGLTDDAIALHDPTWGPQRAMALAEFERRWTAAQSWMLRITPADGRIPPPLARAATTASTPAPRPRAPACDRAMDVALDRIGAEGLTVADRALAEARPACAGDPRPARELAGVRLAESRAIDASRLARDALRLDPVDRYAWDVLGSSLFLQDDATGALRAWNRIDRPQLDAVELRGLTRSRYALIARTTGLTPNTRLTADAFMRARRRLEQLPDRAASSVMLRPGADGYAVVSATVQETSRTPRGLVPWAAAGIQTVINREIVAPVAGWSGQGELWTGSWRWWEHRPRVALSLAAPRTGRLGGVWKVEGAWEAQTYATGEAAGPRREERRTGLLSVRQWITGRTRVDARAGLDTWDGERRAVVTGGTVEQHLFDDRLTLAGAVDRWSSLGATDSFVSGAVTASFRSSRASRGVVVTAVARADAASAAAPLALWSGAGEGRGRPGLLRAHLMLYDGIIDASVFGRRSAVANLELQHWRPGTMAAIALAAFADLGVAGDRFVSAPGRPFQADVGGGVRARVPGQPGTFRLDYAHGVVDGSQRVTAGWNIELP